MSAQRNTNPEVTMFTIKANLSTVHIAGIEERTPAQHDSEEAASARGYVAYYAESACGGLTRSGHRMETLGEYADIEAALNAAEVATYSISGRKVCKTCKAAAEDLLNARAEHAAEVAAAKRSEEHTSEPPSPMRISFAVHRL